MELAGMKKAERHALALQALQQVGLAAYAGSYPDELSGGMQQRVGLARALACDPSILLMDEAFSALDPIMRTEMQSEILRLQQIKRRTIVFISHDLDEAMRIGDRVAIMKDGHVVQVGTPEDILRKPANDYVRNFVRGVDTAAVFKAGDIARKSQIVVSESPTRGSRAALSMLEEQDRAYAYVVNPANRFLGIVSVDSLRTALDGHTGPLGLAHAYLPDVQTINADEPVAGLFGQVAQLPYAVPVVDSTGSFRGAISKTILLKFLDRDTPAIAEQHTQKGQA
jgi:glycine betaine/proline transport system ATP-binding protein